MLKPRGFGGGAAISIILLYFFYLLHSCHILNISRAFIARDTPDPFNATNFSGRIIDNASEIEAYSIEQSASNTTLGVCAASRK